MWVWVLMQTMRAWWEVDYRWEKSRNQPWLFTARTDAEAPILRPPDEKSRLIVKDPDARKDWRQKQKRAAEDDIDIITNSLGMSLSKLRETVKDREAWHSTVHAIADSQMWLKNWTLEKSIFDPGLHIQCRYTMWNAVVFFFFLY